jgi:amino acid adenylation domain-containing protein
VHPSDAVAADFRHTSVTLDGGDAYTPMSELTSLRPEHLPPTLANMVERAAYEPFGVTENASLFRVRLIQILGDGRKSRIPVKGAPQEKEECTLFVFALSALVGDIWSMTVLLDDFRVLYAGSLNMPHIDLTIGPSGVMSPETRDALAEMSETVLEPLVMDYSVYSEWQRARLLGTSGADDLLSPISQAGATLTDQATRFSAFWSEVMSGTLPVLSLPNLVERPRMNETPAAEKDGAITLPSFASVPFVIPAALTKRLIALATSERTELNSLLISAFQLFLFRYTGQDDVLLGGQASCRANLETQNVVGPFSNTVLYRSNTSGNHIFRTYLQSTRQQIIGVRAHSDYPMTLLLQRLLSSQQITSSTALFPTLGSNSLFAASFDFEYPESSRFQDNLVYTVAAFASAVHGPSTHVGGLRLQPLELPCSNSLVTPFDAAPLAVRMSEVGGEMRGQLRYDARTYKEDLMRRMTSHWEQLLSNIVINPDVKVSDLNLLNSIERNLLLHDWNQTSTIHSPAQWQHNPSRARLIHQWFESQATLTPESCAIEYIDPVTTLSELWTYRQLNERANQLAHYLRYLGVQPDQPVPIVLDRSPKLVLSLLAVLKAGAAAMPLDPTVPSERIKFLVHQSEAVLVISETTHFIRLAGMYSRDRLKFNGVNKDLIAECRKKEEENQDEQKEDGAAQLSLNLSSHSVYLLNLDLEMHLIRSGNTQNLPSNIQPSATAYVLFTSGSTGVPKGCMLTHANLLNYITWFVAEYGIVPTDRAAHIANMAFDASMMETWPTLCRGGCIVQGANDDIKLVPSKLVTWMHAHRVTFTFLTTQLCHQFLEASYPADFTLRYLFTGGDRLQRGAREEAKFALVNVYGPTESTINVTVHTVPGGTVQPPPIGRPIANTQLYIVDAYMQPVPLGICGELMIGGLGVGRGYFNRPDLTAEKFIPNPFYHISPSSLLADDASKAGSKVSSSDHDPSLHSHSPLLYRTGDLVRYRSSGLLEFVGRQDQQVKIRGYRIEMAEIESAFLAHPIVSEICVVVTTQEKEKKLLAYVVTRDAKKKHHEQEKKAESDSTSNKIPSLLPPAIPYQEFKKFLREKIPSYMIPSALLYLEFMPLTNNGKVHRAILPVPDWNDEGVLRTLGQTSSDTYVPAVTPIEKLVVRIVRQLLNIPKQKRISLQGQFSCQTRLCVQIWFTTLTCCFIYSCR